jgi:hypothetical protein
MEGAIVTVPVKGFGDFFVALAAFTEVGEESQLMCELNEAHIERVGLYAIFIHFFKRSKQEVKGFWMWVLSKDAAVGQFQKHAGLHDQVEIVLNFGEAALALYVLQVEMFLSFVEAGFNKIHSLEVSSSFGLLAPRAFHNHFTSMTFRIEDR